jgi:hypothetical protein
MEYMINYKRVKRIKNAIYIFIVLLFLMPAILFLVVSVKMLRIMPELSRMIAESRSAYVQVQGQSSPPQPLDGEASDTYPSETAKLPVPQGTSQAQTASGSDFLQAESSASEIANTSRGQSPLTAVAVPDSQPVEQSEVLPPHGGIQSPNTGLPR